MKCYKYYILPISIFVIIVFSKCTSDKRLYQKGHHISWQKNTSQNKSSSIAVKHEHKIKNELVENKENNQVKETQIEEPLFASVDNSYSASAKKTKNTQLNLITDNTSTFKKNITNRESSEVKLSKIKSNNYNPLIWLLNFCFMITSILKTILTLILLIGTIYIMAIYIQSII
jgi:hypothetical protein